MLFLKKNIVSCVVLWEKLVCPVENKMLFLIITYMSNLLDYPGRSLINTTSSGRRGLGQSAKKHKGWGYTNFPRPNFEILFENLRYFAIIK